MLLNELSVTCGTVVIRAWQGAGGMGSAGYGDFSSPFDIFESFFGGGMGGMGGMSGMGGMGSMRDRPIKGDDERCRSCPSLLAPPQMHAQPHPARPLDMSPAWLPSLRGAAALLPGMTCSLISWKPSLASTLRSRSAGL